MKMEHLPYFVPIARPHSKLSLISMTNKFTYYNMRDGLWKGHFGIFGHHWLHKFRFWRTWAGRVFPATALGARWSRAVGRCCKEKIEIISTCKYNSEMQQYYCFSEIKQIIIGSYLMKNRCQDRLTFHQPFPLPRSQFQSFSLILQIYISR